ncbi:acyl-CoA thioesterase [Variovorax terrae]|uniref:Thioesterase family protein n=1 Tax=Variovorax terrae TaxID=2923278 RepID=A0A9X1VQE1_9BURK|nr:thioesterase family protein [Variovorax terrae]MCJ0761896.1 thioesterase family protein [Variovorax terrae]
MSAHPFDQAIALAAQPDGNWLGHTSAAYANMVGPFGGVTAAQALNAVLQHPQRLGEPVALTVNFAAALADGPFTVEARPARTNRSTQHWIIEMRQDGQTVLTATAFTALRRDTWSADDEPMPQVPGPAETRRADMRNGRVEWVKRYDLRFVHGFFPPEWDGTERDSLTQLWVRDEPPRPLDFASLTALSDVFFPRLWRRRASMVPIGTVSMTIYFHADAAQLQATGTSHLLGQARAQAFRNGFFDQTAQLWNEAGELLVTTHQVVYYKE